MSSGPYFAIIIAAHTSLSGHHEEPRRIFRPGDSIQLNIVHQFVAWRPPLPPVPLHYYAIAILQSIHQGGFFQAIDGEAVYQFERGVFSEGTYESSDSVLTVFDLGRVPADPVAAYDAAFWAARERANTREAVIQELVNGDNGIEFSPGVWGFQPILVLRDPDAGTPEAVTLDLRVWEPWYYMIVP